MLTSGSLFVRNVTITLSPIVGTEIVLFSLVDAVAPSAAARKKRNMINAERNSPKSFHSEDSLLSGIVHELRTPLASILGFAEIILSEPGLETAKRQEFTSIIKQEGERLSDLIESLVDGSFLEEDGHLKELREYNIVALISLVLDALEDRIASKSLTVRREFEQPNVPVPCDRNRIIHVLSLLLSNAVGSARDQGIVTAGARLTESTAQFWITDDGTGIPEREIPFLFQKFHHDPLSGHEDNKYTPGFSQVKKIIELHGGTVSVQSKEDAGTTFIVVLPLRTNR